MLINPANRSPLVSDERGLVDTEGKVFPLIKGAYRIVQSAGYTGNFGFQWNQFKKTQLDKFSGKNQSRERFFKVTGWDKENLSGKNVLEVGSGAGRFTQIVLDHTQANLYSVDYSNAVEANYENNGPNERLKLFQASIYELPFEEGSFDKVFCFGVLQHTPDIQKSIECLYKMLKPGGELVVDFYPYKGFWTKLNAKYFLRPLLKRLPDKTLLKLIQSNINWMIAASNLFIKLKINRVVNRFIPVCDIKVTLPTGMDKKQLKEWAILDTFDIYSPVYDQPQRIQDVQKHFADLNMKSVFGGYIRYEEFNSVSIVKGFK